MFNLLGIRASVSGEDAEKFVFIKALVSGKTSAHMTASAVTHRIIFCIFPFGTSAYMTDENIAAAHTPSAHFFSSSMLRTRFHGDDYPR